MEKIINKSSGCMKCGCPSDFAHYNSCPELGKYITFPVKKKIEKIDRNAVDIIGKINEIIEVINS